MWNLRRDWLFQTIHQGTYDYNYNIIILTSSSSFFCSSSTSNSSSTSPRAVCLVPFQSPPPPTPPLPSLLPGWLPVSDISDISDICGCWYHIILYHRYHLVSQDDDNGVMNERWCYDIMVKMEILMVIIVKVFCSPTPCSLTPSRPSSPPPPPPPTPPRVLFLPPPRPYLIF